MLISRSGVCVTLVNVERGRRARASSSVCPTFLRRSRWRLFGQAVEGADGRWNTGATNSTIQYYNPCNSNIPPRRRYNAVTAQHINRGARSACASALFPPLAVSRSSPLHTLRGISFPRGAAHTLSASLPFPLSRSSRMLPPVVPFVPVAAFAFVVPSPFDRVSSRFHLVERLYLIGWIINHR